jgi:hypothetical protein
MLSLRTVASIKAGLLFLIIGSPLMYKLTQDLLGGLFKISSKGCPTTAGLLLHALVLGLITYFLMGICMETFENNKDMSEETPEEIPVEGYEDSEMVEEGFENAQSYNRCSM